MKFYAYAVAAMLLGASTLSAADKAFAGSLISVDLQSRGVVGFDQQQLFSGVDPIAQAANGVFGSADQWNHLNTHNLDQSAQDPAVFNNLKDSTGAPTGVSFSVTGGIKGYSLFGRYAGFTDPLRNDYWFFNSENNLTTSLDWRLAGLAPSTRYRFFAYGGLADAANPGRQFSLLADSDGDGSLANETAQIVTADGLLLTLKTDANGVLLGQSSGIGAPSFANEANWAGFQIAAAPRSAPTPALLPGLIGLGVAAWKKRQRAENRSENV